MLLPKFDYYSPTSLKEALEWLAAHHHEDVAILGGGTDLLVNLKGKVIPDGHRPRCQEHRSGPWKARHEAVPKPKWVLALSRVPELRGIRIEDSPPVSGEGFLPPLRSRGGVRGGSSSDSPPVSGGELKGGQIIRIGAMTTHTQLERSELIQTHLAGLADAAAALGSPLCRNRGTYGGNICNARPASDTTIPTLALGGELVLASVRGERIVAHSEFVTAPGKTVLEPDEILKEVVFRVTEPAPLSAYIKLANRKALEIAVVGVAAAVWFEPGSTDYSRLSRLIGTGAETRPPNPRILKAHIALASVAPKPVLAVEAGESLAGGELTRERIAEAARIAAGEVKPITDHRGGAEYRRVMVEVLVRRTLHKCLERAAVTAGEAV